MNAKERIQTIRLIQKLDCYKGKKIVSVFPEKQVINLKQSEKENKAEYSKDTDI